MNSNVNRIQSEPSNGTGPFRNKWHQNPSKLSKNQFNSRINTSKFAKSKSSKSRNQQAYQSSYPHRHRIPSIESNYSDVTDKEEVASATGSSSNTSDVRKQDEKGSSIYTFQDFRKKNRTSLRKKITAFDLSLNTSKGHGEKDVDDEISVSVDHDDTTIYSGGSGVTDNEDRDHETKKPFDIFEETRKYYESEEKQKNAANLLMEFVIKAKADASKSKMQRESSSIKHRFSHLDQDEKTLHLGVTDEEESSAIGSSLNTSDATQYETDVNIFSQDYLRSNPNLGDSLINFNNIDNVNPIVDEKRRNSGFTHEEETSVVCSSLNTSDTTQNKTDAFTRYVGPYGIVSYPNSAHYNNSSIRTQNGNSKAQVLLQRAKSFQNKSVEDHALKNNNKRKFYSESDEEDSKLIDQIPMQRAVSCQGNELRKDGNRKNLSSNFRTRSNTVPNSSSKSSLYSYLKEHDQNKIKLLAKEGINEESINRLQYPDDLCDDIDRKGFDNAIRDYILKSLPAYDEFQYKEKFLDNIMKDINLIICLEIPTTVPKYTEAKMKKFMGTYIQNLHPDKKIHKYVRSYLYDLSFKDVAEHFANDQQFEEKCSINS